MEEKTYPNGLYLGSLVGDERSGRGKMTYTNRDVYDGYWENDVRSERGVMKYANRDVYMGLWENDVRSGQGTMKYGKRNNEYRKKYEGTWKNDKPDGEGTMTYANGNVYVGEWDDGEPVNGTLTYPNGDVYTGESWKGLPNGDGEMTYANGDVYEGNWENGEPNGEGTMTYANEDVYVGEWDHGARSGEEGTMRHANGDVYVGEWDDDEPVHGTMTYANRDVYQGDWEAGERHGQGMLTNANGDIIHDGFWANDEPVNDQQQVQIQGIAYEIHNASDKINMNKYYELLQIDSPAQHYASIDMIAYIKGHFTPFVGDKAAILDAVLNKAAGRIERDKLLIGRTIDYVMKQSDAFKELYISTFILDCSEAYDGPGDGMSCAKGIVERIKLSLIPPLISATSSKCEEAAEVCINHKKLLKLLTQDINMPEIIQEWSNKADIQDMTEEERKKDFIAFITSKYVELGMPPPTEQIQAKADEINYVFKDLAWGSKRRGYRRTKRRGTKRRSRRGTKRRGTKRRGTKRRRHRRTKR